MGVVHRLAGADDRRGDVGQQGEAGRSRGELLVGAVEQECVGAAVERQGGSHLRVDVAEEVEDDGDHQQRDRRVDPGREGAQGGDIEAAGCDIVAAADVGELADSPQPANSHEVTDG